MRAAVQAGVGLPAARPRVIVFPPVIPLSGFASGVLLEKLVPAAPAIAPAIRLAMRGVGACALLGGAVGFAWMVRTMKKAKTPIHNSKTPTKLVETGPFALTRNPMYLFGATAYAGAALLGVQPWSLALLPLVLFVTHYGVVLREEKLLDELFGDAYVQYKAKVRRWI